MLYRCRMESADFTWYISIVPPGKDPGTQEDQDFYCLPAARTAFEAEPPVGRWQSCENAYKPGPLVSFKKKFMNMVYEYAIPEAYLTRILERSATAGASIGWWTIER